MLADTKNVYAKTGHLFFSFWSCAFSPRVTIFSFEFSRIQAQIFIWQYTIPSSIIYISCVCVCVLWHE